jgi:hypothetical protein
MSLHVDLKMVARADLARQDNLTVGATSVMRGEVQSRG